MATIRTILFATDFSEGSARACDLARTLVNLSSARLVVLHALTELVDRRSKRLTSEAIDIVIREVEQHAVEDMKTFCTKYFTGLEYSTEIVLGHGHEQILAGAEKHKADLIMMGTHGRSGLEKMLVGSTAEKVVRTSPVPVLVVRE